MDDSKKKWYLFAGLAVIVVGLVVVLFVSVFRPSGCSVSGVVGSVPVVIPDGDVASLEESKSKVYRGSTESYFEQLSAAEEGEISLVSDSLRSERLPVKPAMTEKARGSSVERVFGAPASSAPLASSADTSKVSPC